MYGAVSIFILLNVYKISKKPFLLKKIFMTMTIKKLILICSILLSVFTLFGQTEEANKEQEVQQALFNNKKNKILSNVIVSSLERAHYAPRELNDSLSLDFFNEYVKSIDRGKNFLLQEDFDILSDYKYNLDDQLATDRLDFFNLSISILEKRTLEVQKIYRKILESPFDFTLDEDIELDADKVKYCTSKEELTERWRKALKYQTLNRISSNKKKQTEEAEKSDTIQIKTFAELEESARESILKRQDEWFHRMIDQVNNTDRISIYENAFTAVYDPHTNYFPPKLKEDFDIRFSGQLEGIGATLSPKDGYIRIVEVVPGSPAWKTGKITKEDLIMKVGQANEDPVDVYDMRLDDAVKLIRGPKGTEVRLTIKKKDGTIKVVPIIRDIVIREETYVKTSIIQTEDIKDFEVGYIYLPSFYTNLNDPKGRSCGDDMKEELEKMSKEGIENIILDLRGNGGGSLRDAVQIAGLFIDQGPVVQRKSSIGQFSVLRDPDNITNYDGNLVILVNETSASASEILAAALQDYNRAVIVGGNSTFGKGTVQQFIDLDRMLPSQYNEYKSFGSLKITMEKFYRINGGATQLKGVIPDIILPTNYSNIEFGEKEMDYALEWDEIADVAYKRLKKYIPDYDYIVNKSKERVNSNEDFSKIKEYSLWVKENRENTIKSLNFNTYEATNNEKELYLEQFDHIGEDTLSLLVRDLRMDAPKIDSDSIKRTTTDEWYDDITKDHYILEGVYILNDLKAIRKS
jgi:carboxyl-terminal processing protease